MSDLGVAPYESRRREDVLRLLADVWGEPPPAGELEWWFDGNPVGPRTVVLAEDAGRVAGVLGASHYRAVVDGRDTLVTLPLYAATDPGYRGRGIFQQLNGEIERAAREAGASLLLGFTNRMAGPIYVAKLGWLDVACLRVWARPLSPLGRRRGGDLERFGPEQEQAYRAVALRLRSHFVRDAAYLNWRFADSPRDYTLLASRNGYAVVGRKRFRGVDVGYVADLVAATAREARWLLRRCTQAARGARVLLALRPALHGGAFAASGFVPTPYRIRLIGKSLGGPLPLGAGRWHFTLGDTDFF